jgi:hypothetical protein
MLGAVITPLVTRTAAAIADRAASRAAEHACQRRR